MHWRIVNKAVSVTSVVCYRVDSFLLIVYAAVYNFNFLFSVICRFCLLLFKMVSMFQWRECIATFNCIVIGWSEVRKVKYESISVFRRVQNTSEHIIIIHKLILFYPNLFSNHFWPEILYINYWILISRLKKSHNV